MMHSNLFLCLAVSLLITACAETAPSQPKNNEPEEASAETQTPSPLDRFEPAIEAFEAQDKQQPSDSNTILFIGSSSIRMWSSLTEDMAPAKVLNRGFGGSTIPEVSYYASRIIFPYAPDTIVLYCGENDIADGASPQKVYESFTALMARIRLKLPETTIFFISMKPSIARWELWNQYQEGNELIETYIDKYPKLHYLDCSASMLQPGGGIDSTIFIEDGLHMNASGYERWTAMVRPALGLQ